MKIDKKIHKEILLQLISQSQIPGEAVEVVYELILAIKSAEVIEE